MLYDMRTQAGVSMVSPDRSAMALYSRGKPIWLWTGEHWSAEGLRSFFLKFLMRVKEKPCGIVAEKKAAEQCGIFLSGRYVAKLKEREIISYYLPAEETFKARKVSAPGCVLRQAALKDAGFLTEWVAGFYRDALQAKPPHDEDFRVLAKRGASVSMDAPRLYILEDKSGSPSGMGMLCGGDHCACRLNMVCVPVEKRRQGYGKIMVELLCEKILSRDKMPVLYTSAENAAANALYRSVGFKEAGRLTEFIF
ncbi:MAG: GNAT family N-acetyltransferase [Clostridiales bacterium]|jgi:ribosomal protein S18 acetylase RimI-like enzyme|nr:GNAT family N-acetyltransferase [Clostridiales bacterium]